MRCLLILSCLTAPSIAGIPQEQASFNAAALAKRSLPAVVLVKGTTMAGEEVSASGFIVDPLGTIVTNLHVIQSLKTGAVRLANGDVYDHFTIRAFDERRDLAIIQIRGFDLPVLPLGNSNGVEPGQAIVLLGNPLGLEGSISAGIISGIRRFPDGFQTIQTDAAANPGNSGGPLINGKGQVVGVFSFKLRGTENLNFVIPINYARGLLRSTDAISLDELRARLGKTFHEDSRTPVFPHRWKSLAKSGTKILRLDGERLYVETLPSRQPLGSNDYMIADLKKDGEKYAGLNRCRFTCEYSDSLKVNHNSCVEETIWSFHLSRQRESKVGLMITR